MSSNQSAGDFGCCGSWLNSCGSSNGCAYGQYLTNEDERNLALVHAMKHCNIFKQLFLDKDPEFTASWLASAERAKAEIQWKKDHPEEIKVEPVSATTAINEAKDLLKSLGISI